MFAWFKLEQMLFGHIKKTQTKSMSSFPMVYDVNLCRLFVILYQRCFVKNQRSLSAYFLIKMTILLPQSYSLHITSQSP